MKKTKKILENKNHWKSYFDHEYIGGFSLTDMDAIVTIVRYVQEEVVNHKTNQKSIKFVLYVKDKKGEHKMILNATNGKNIENALGTPDPELWLGKNIQLFSERGTWFGNTSDALRVRDIAPEQDNKIDVSEDLKTLNNVKKLEDLPIVYKTLKNWSNPEVIALKDKLKTELK